MTKLKVYAGMTIAPNTNRQVEAVVAATSWRAAAQALGISLHFIREYWAVTGNAHQIAAALADPGVALYCVTPGYARADSRYVRKEAYAEEARKAND